jgi:hypothetical protein
MNTIEIILVNRNHLTPALSAGGSAEREKRLALIVGKSDPTYSLRVHGTKFNLGEFPTMEIDR